VTRFRIVEIVPNCFEIQYKGWFFWHKAYSYRENNLEAARARLEEVRRDMEWIPKIYE
jgi:hypothetical protein